MHPPHPNDTPSTLNNTWPNDTLDPNDTWGLPQYRGGCSPTT